MNKRFFIIVLLALLAIGLGVLFSLKAKPPQQTVVPIVHYAARPPAITSVENAPADVIVSYVGEQPNIPSSLPVYQFTNHTYTNDETTTIAKSLGFPSLPTKLLYGKETRVVWKSSEATLSLTTSGAHQSWSYALFQSKTKTAPTQSLSELARLFVEKNFFSTEAAGLVLQKEMPTPIEHIQTEETPKPTLRGYLFIKKTPNSYGVVSSQFSPYLISVIIDHYGVVRNISFASSPIVSQGQEGLIISVNDAVASINKGLGLLISVTRNGDSYWEKTPQFKTVSLSDVQIVYYPNQATFLLTPFYLFHGTATTTDGLVVDVVYAVSAVE